MVTVLFVPMLLVANEAMGAPPSTTSSGAIIPESVAVPVRGDAGSGAQRSGGEDVIAREAAGQGQTGDIHGLVVANVFILEESRSGAGDMDVIRVRDKNSTQRNAGDTGVGSGVIDLVGN